MGVEVHSLHIVSTDIARGGDTSQCGRDKSTSPFSHTILVQGRVPHISPWSMKGRLFTWPLLVGLESKIKFYSLVFDWTIYQLLSKSFLSCLAALFLVFLLEKVGISWIFFFFWSTPICLPDCRFSTTQPRIYESKMKTQGIHHSCSLGLWNP